MESLGWSSFRVSLTPLKSHLKFKGRIPGQIHTLEAENPDTLKKVFTFIRTSGLSEI